MQVGFIGLGVMGLPMAGHLVAAGHTVSVSSRSQGPVDAAVAAGCVDAGDPAGVAAASDAIVVCVPDTPDVEGVVGGLLPALRPGTVVIDCSTIDPAAEARLAALVADSGGLYVDAPVSGGDTGARAGTLTVMVGGSDEAFAAASPVIEAFAGKVVHVGAIGSGQLVKLANNVLYAIQMAGVSEVFTMLAKSGVDLPTALDVITASSGDCTAVRLRVPFEGVQPTSPVSNGWRPGFATALMAKDVRLGLAQMAATGVPSSSAQAAYGLLLEAIDRGWGGDDMAAMGRVVRAQADSF